jgi:phage gp29-like protein
MQYGPIDPQDFSLPEEEEEVYEYMVEDNLESRLEAEARPGMAAMLAAIETLLSESSSLPEFQAKLAVAYPDLDGAELERVLGQALFANRLAGIFDAQEGD